MSVLRRAWDSYRRDGFAGILHGVRWRTQRFLGDRGLIGAGAAGLRLLAKSGPRAFASRVRWGLHPVETAPPDQPHPWKSSLAYYFAFNPLFDLNAAELEANRSVTGKFSERGEAKSATWFITYFDHALFGGIYTILRLMDFMQRVHGVQNRIVVFDRPTATDKEIRKAVVDAFPSLADVDIVIPGPAGIDYDELPPTDIAIATMWISAYPLARFNRTRAKFYMVQDFEPNFYPAGSSSALAEATYRFGYAGIVNTPGLGEVYRSYGNPAVDFVPAVEYAASSGLDAKPSNRSGAPTQVVLYGRPSTDRNAFELIAAAAIQLKNRYGKSIRIVSAGEDWSPQDLGLEGVIENRGRLDSLGEVRRLYQDSDIGIAFMLSKHPSYQPFEYLAAGVAPVVNVNSATAWFLVDGENCSSAEPFPSEIARAVAELIEDPELRARLVTNGQKRVSDTSWESELSRVWSFVTGHE